MALVTPKLRKSDRTLTVYNVSMTRITKHSFGSIV